MYYIKNYQNFEFHQPDLKKVHNVVIGNT